MRVFVTGAAGFIGRALTQELIQHGHSVLGLSRSEKNAEILRKLGAESHHGDLEDVESLRSGARAADAVIHLGFIHDFSKFEQSLVVDRQAIQAMGEELVGKPFIIVSGTMAYPPGALSTEDTEPLRDGTLAARNLSSDLLFKLSKEIGVLGAVVRLAPTVHGKEDQGFMVMIGDLSKKAGGSYYVDDGSNQWPAVHRLDAAALLRLAIEKKPAPGGVTYNGVAENVLTKDFMTTIGKKLNVPVEGKPQADVNQALGFFGHLLGHHNPTSSEKTQKTLGWTPTQIGLIADLEQNYFLQLRDPGFYLLLKSRTFYPKLQQSLV
ncbi:NAD dependent epimerase/dehydratase, putative [Talaromyces stipitatus ATCC 10500]|uniref:NAD dependent epimerase/dehydratase, putative n=1 Tax=Talaromyces stipitatus (strain ATCC 10500 / CBS 375.48 / QM 6759 / NRRL 1006) TaxID=441959 RepID=B8MAA6_TALSN|nr:NAD dependent epimerase/dehydratase, putative [Talaromyces stipitatus ATCC 10500]EED18608.1 NAD dependent epimerase/dehydratase, putative [Talaromyces stipitatus ATCC 10500]